MNLIGLSTDILASNAIQVKNIGRQQVGHIPRDVAKNLARLMDEKKVTVEGVIHDGNCAFTLSTSNTLFSYSQIFLRCSDWQTVCDFHVSSASVYKSIRAFNSSCESGL